MSQQFQVYLDARGDLSAADGVVIDRGTGTVWPVGDGTVRPGVSGSPARHLADAVEIPRMQGITLLGGSGRNVILSGPAGLAGIYRPGRPGIWTMGELTLEVTGTSAATISDATDVVAELSSGGAAPAGDYVATEYGEDTYNGSAAFTMTAATEYGWPGAPNDLLVEISGGTAVAGLYTSTDGVNYECDADPDWTITLAADGTSSLSYDGTPMATRAAELSDDPCGLYQSTLAGQALRPDLPFIADGPAPESNPFGVLTLEFNWSGTPDLDIGVTFLGQTVGYGYLSSASHITWSGDNTTDGGPETVVIDLAAAWDAGEIFTHADVLALADWYPPAGGNGPAQLTVTYDLPSAPGTPTNHTIHPGSASPAITPSLALRILEDGSVEPAGSEWFANVMAVRRPPVDGVCYIAITESAGEVSGVAGPFFAEEVPTPATGTVYFPIATSDGAGGLKQIHTGPLLWSPTPL